MKMVMETAIYGFEVRPGDSGYWAGVVIKGTLSVKNSTMMSDGVSGYSLYDTASWKSSILCIRKLSSSWKW